MKPLVIIPTFLREEKDVEVTMDAVRSVRNTEGGNVDILLVDDGSPERECVEKLCGELGPFDARLHEKEDNDGFSRTVNVGLVQALDEGRDAVLLNADVEIQTEHWLGRMRNTIDGKGRPAAVVGALLLFPSGMIQHGGVYFSLLTRTFDHLWKYSPMNLPAAHRQRECPVTAAFQFIRHETLTVVGLYDEEFQMGWEDVDFCIRTFMAGLSCVYNPDVRAWHYEMLFRGRPSPKVAEWQQKSWMRLAQKWGHVNFNELVPFLSAPEEGE